MYKTPTNFITKKNFTSRKTQKSFLGSVIAFSSERKPKYRRDPLPSFRWFVVLFSSLSAFSKFKVDNNRSKIKKKTSTDQCNNVTHYFLQKGLVIIYKSCLKRLIFSLQGMSFIKKKVFGLGDE